MSGADTDLRKVGLIVKNLSEARRAHGLSQHEFAKLAGVSPSDVKFAEKRAGRGVGTDVADTLHRKIETIRSNERPPHTKPTEVEPVPSKKINGR